MKVKKLSNTLGVELLEFDVRERCDPKQQLALRTLFSEHHLILIRGQQVSKEDHDRFVNYFGPTSPPLENADSVYVTNKSGEKRLFGPGTEILLWHSDGTYGPHPGIGTSLLALDVDAKATPTEFANAMRALDALPKNLKERIKDLEAVHLRDTKQEQTNKPFKNSGINKSLMNGRYRSCCHPIIYQPPHLESPVLFVNQLLTSHVLGLEEEESEDLLKDLYHVLYAKENVYAHQWQDYDLIIWDNIALQHRRPRQMGHATRHLRRASLDGWWTDSGELLEWYATGTKKELETIKKSAGKNECMRN